MKNIATHTSKKMATKEEAETYAASFRAAGWAMGVKAVKDGFKAVGRKPLW